MGNNLFAQAIESINFNMEPVLVRKALCEIWFDGRVIECSHSGTPFVYIAKSMSEFEDKKIFWHEVETALEKKFKESNVVVIEIYFNKKDGFFCWFGMSQPKEISYLLGPVYAVKMPTLKKESL